MRCSEADGDEQIGALGFARNNRAIGDGIGRKPTHLHISLVEDAAPFGVALHIVRVHGVGGHADTVSHSLPALAVMLRHDHVGNHPPGFPHINLVGPATVVCELIAAETPGRNFGSDLGGNPFVIGQEVHQSLLIFGVCRDDLRAAGVVGFGIIIAFPNKISRKGPAVVAVGLAVGHGNVRAERVPDSGLDITTQQFVVLGTVVLGFREWDAICRSVGQAHAKVVGLHTPVSGPVTSRCSSVDAEEQATGGIPGFLEGVD